MTFTPTSSVAASSTGFSYLIFFSAKNDWETGRQLVNHYTVYFRAGDLGRGSVCGTLEGTTPCNKSRGQVPLCELTIFASTFSRGEPTLVPSCKLLLHGIAAGTSPFVMRADHIKLFQLFLFSLANLPIKSRQQVDIKLSKICQVTKVRFMLH